MRLAFVGEVDRGSGKGSLGKATLEKLAERVFLKRSLRKKRFHRRRFVLTKTDCQYFILTR